MADVNPYLNTPPTKLKRDLAGESDGNKKKLMKDALSAWRSVVPGPFRKGSDMNRQIIARRLLKMAEELTDRDGHESFTAAADPERRAEFLSVLKGINSLRGKFEPTSDAGIFLAIVRDMAVHISRGNSGAVSKLSKEMIDEFAK